jgi:hypothetical protein
MAQNSTVYDPEAPEKLSVQNPDQAFSNLTNAEHFSKDGNPPELSGGRTADSGSLKSMEEHSGGASSSNGASASDTLGRGFGALSPASKFLVITKVLNRNRKKGLIGGGIVVSIIGVLFTIFLGLIPLKIEHIVQNLQNHFFATSENAVKKETNKMLETYIVKNVIPGYRSCKSTTEISLSCRATHTLGTNPVANLYNSWSDAKLETKLANDYGIEFRRNISTGAWSLKAPGSGSGQILLGKEGDISVNSLDNEFQKADRASMRSAIKDAMENETLSKKVFYRYKVGKLLEEKYGIKRCLVFCGTKDALASFKDSKKNAVKIFLTQRVLVPLNESRGVVLLCILDPNCTTDKPPVSSPAETGVNAELSGAPEDSLDKNIRTNLVELAGKYGITDSATIDKLIKDYGNAADKGFTAYAITQVLEKIGISEATTQLATDMVPIYGQINLVSNIITGMSKLKPIVKKLSYATNAVAAVSLYMSYRTYADEIHTGHVDSTEVGSFVTSLSDGNNGSVSDPEVGGTASAEATPLYGYLINSSSPTTTPLLGNFAGTKAYADSTSNTSSYLCSNGSPVPAGKLVCDEEILGKGNAVVDSIDKVTSSPWFQPIKFAAGIVSKLSGLVGSIIGGFLFDLIPGALTVSNYIGHLFSPLFNDIIRFLFPSPFSSNMSGGRTFNMMAAGADVSGNDTAHTVLGGKVLTNSQVASIRSEQDGLAQQNFTHQSFFARMFDTNSQYSLVSKVALMIPFNYQKSMGVGFASIISNPFKTLSDVFGSLSAIRTFAATTSIQDSFNIPQYGYTNADLSAIGDPSTYWDANCSDNASQAYMNNNSWNEDAAKLLDDNTGTPKNTLTNPCLLIKSVVGTAGAVFNSSLLTADEAQAAGN